jgi:ABC-type antimicrobial peptide transport system permease subunit
MWQRLQRHRLAQVGFTIVLVLLLVAIFAPLISPGNSPQRCKHSW